MKYIITLLILINSFNIQSQTIIIAEDVVMRKDTLIDPAPFFIQYKSIEQSKIEKLELEIEELKSQIKELSELLLTLIKK